MAEYFARHGGVHFQTLADPETINAYIREMPSDKRDSLFEVLQELDRAGLITLTNDHIWADGTGQTGGSSEC